MIPEYTLECIPILRKIAKQKPPTAIFFKAAFPIESSDCIRTICDFAANALYNDSIALSKKTKESLAPYKEIYIKLARKKTSRKEKGLLISTKGHLFVYPLVKAILPKVVQHVNS